MCRALPALAVASLPQCVLLTPRLRTAAAAGTTTVVVVAAEQQVAIGK